MLCQTPTSARSGLCTACQDLMPVLGNTCRQCASPLPSNSRHNLICGNCLREPPAFDHTRSLFAYAHPTDHLIQQMKFHARLDIARCFGELLAEHFADELAMTQALLPVPLHISRLRQRGFNQALEIGRYVAKVHRLPLLTHACIRQHATANQSELPFAERSKNVRRAFRITGDIDFRSIAIIDDVITTGQTVQALSLALKHHGIEQIKVLSCARTILNR